MKKSLREYENIMSNRVPWLNIYNYDVRCVIGLKDVELLEKNLRGQELIDEWKKVLWRKDELQASDFFPFDIRYYDCLSILDVDDNFWDDIFEELWKRTGFYEESDLTLAEMIDALGEMSICDVLYALD